MGYIWRIIYLSIYQNEVSQDVELTPIGICTDIERLLNIITNEQSNRISRLKVQLDGGKQFLKLTVIIVSMLPNSHRQFRAWNATDLPWSLTSHILSDHYMDYLLH